MPPSSPRIDAHGPCLTRGSVTLQRLLRPIALKIVNMYTGPTSGGDILRVVLRSVARRRLCERKHAYYQSVQLFLDIPCNSRLVVSVLHLTCTFSDLHAYCAAHMMTALSLLHTDVPKSIEFDYHAVVL